MYVPVLITASSALFLSLNTFYLNSYILLAIFCLKKAQKKSDMTLIYSRFAVDVVYALCNCFNLTYFLIRVVSPDTVVKNLSFYIAWPTYNLGSIRVFLVFFIIIDRLCASYFPIFYHKNRSKLPNLSIFLSLFVYAIFEQIILFKFCQFEIDIPTSCLHLGCSVNKCYHDYWLWFEQIGYFSIGLSSGVLCFRLFVWSRLSKNQTNKRISRTTRISLLDTVIIFAFDILPSFLFTHFPAVNFETVGPLSALCKNFGFVIEAIIICKVLIGKNGVAPINTSKYTPNAS